MNIDVLISEVGPRDGLQSINAIMPLAARKSWITAEARAGVREIEVGSFVSQKLLPQMAATPEVVAHALLLPGLKVAALVPNAYGAEAAVRAGVHKITVPFSASETHSIKNVRRTHTQMLDEVRKIVDVLNNVTGGVRPTLEISISTAFGCTYEGNVSEDKVVRISELLVGAGCDEVGLADSAGSANPNQIKSVVTRVRAAVGDRAFAGLHLHNNRGLGLANALAGLEVGVTTFDSSLSGLGGCPFLPGAAGNIVTEDLVFMLEAMGLKTGINLEMLLSVRKILEDALPGETLYGFTPNAGLPLGFQPANLTEARAIHVG